MKFKVGDKVVVSDYLCGSGVIINYVDYMRQGLIYHVEGIDDFKRIYVPEGRLKLDNQYYREEKLNQLLKVSIYTKIRLFFSILNK